MGKIKPYWVCLSTYLCMACFEVPLIFMTMFRAESATPIPQKEPWAAGRYETMLRVVPCVCISVCVCACIRACAHVCMRACVRGCLHACVRACFRACVPDGILHDHAYALCIHIHGHIHRHWFASAVVSI